MEINITKPVKVNAKEFRILCKVRDDFHAELLDKEGQVLVEYDGYVPSRIMPETNGGDYINLYIDIDTGMILNWGKLSSEDIEAFIEESKE